MAAVTASLVLATALAARAALHERHRRRALRHLVHEGRIESLPAPAWLVRSLAAAGFDVDPARVWTAWVGGTLAAVLMATAAAGVGAGGITAVVACAVPRVVLHLCRMRASHRAEAALPAALEEVARALRSGASLVQALAEAGATTPGAVGEDLRRIAAATTRGGGLVAALQAWPPQRQLPGVRLAATALVMAVGSGGATAKAVDGVAASLRQRSALAAEVAALASSARASAAVIALAPMVFGAFAAVTDPRTARFSLGTPLGLGLLVTGLALDAVGWLWMARITGIDR